MDEIRETLERLGSKLPERVDATVVSPISKLPFKALVYREALAWRMAELGRAAFENYENDKLVSAIVLTRAAVETSAALWYLCAKIAAALDSNALGDTDEYLMKLLMGTATEASATAANSTDVTLPRPFKIGAFLKQVEKEIHGFSHQYGVLSEYSHPSTALVYSKHDMHKRVTEFGRNLRNVDNTKLIGTGNLSGALKLFEVAYRRVGDLMPRFVVLCEAHLKAVNS